MSIQHVGAILHEMPELRGLTDAFVLAVIADSADRRTGWTYDFSLADIAKSSRQTRRNVRKRLRVLEQAGYIRTKLKGKAGRQRFQFRVLFDAAGVRHSEQALYPPGRGWVPRPGEGRSLGPGREVLGTPGEVPRTGGEVRKVSPPNNPLIGDPSLSVSIRKSDQKIASAARTKKIPPAEPSAQDREAAKQAQLARIRRKMAGASP